MISVEAALEHVLALGAPMPVEDVPLQAALGRVLARPMQARLDQPPFAASVMDGYAICEDDARPGARLRVIGEAAAGHGAQIALRPGAALRIFTGAPVPVGASRVIPQEDTTRTGDDITLTALSDNRFIRPAGADFRLGDPLAAPRRLTPSDIALLAAMNHAEIPVHRAPRVALIATGDELVPPGAPPGPDQIIASNGLGLAALVQSEGATPLLLPIAPDTRPGLRAVFAKAEGADLIVTIGGASVGDHDLVADVAADLGLARAFYKIAMRPGKPLMAGRMMGAAMLGLPGNPVSSMVCGHVFLRPLLRVMLGLPARPLPRQSAPLACDLPANGGREHYMRARRDAAGVAPFARQDSALLTVLSDADCLAIRPPDDPPRRAGDMIDILPLT